MRSPRALRFRATPRQVAVGTMVGAIIVATLGAVYLRRDFNSDAAGGAKPETVVDAPAGVPLSVLRAMFRRPEQAMSEDAAAKAKIALGARLFADARLSRDGMTSCATCHDPSRSFADGRRTAASAVSKRYPRNSPSLWNVGTAQIFFWDGRAATLEAQARDAIEVDMGSTAEAAAARLSGDAGYISAATAAFGRDAELSSAAVLAALSAYERSVQSPATRFDRWIDGEAGALTEAELSGLRLFSGKARCLGCHGGWRFTDDRFHDIGLKSEDPGRQAIVGGAERTFKTPSLREAVWSAPYMHDGSLATLEAVIDHYAGNLDQRASLASELKRGIALSAKERADLLAFLKTLSSETMPRHSLRP